MGLNTRDSGGTCRSEVSGIKVAARIMTLWGLTPEEQSKILGINVAALRFSQPLIKLSSSQRIKLSLILNIHASLKQLFSNPENPVCFMRAVNHNPPFLGQTPLMLIRAGKTRDLQCLYDHLQQLQSGNW